MVDVGDLALDNLRENGLIVVNHHLENLDERSSVNEVIVGHLVGPEDIGSHDGAEIVEIHLEMRKN